VYLKFYLPPPEIELQLLSRILPESSAGKRRRKVFTVAVELRRNCLSLSMLGDAIRVRSRSTLIRPLLSLPQTGRVLHGKGLSLALVVELRAERLTATASEAKAARNLIRHSNHFIYVRRRGFCRL
jgi:hypothetical protein